jgi:hypothetical protein
VRKADMRVVSNAWAGRIVPGPLYSGELGIWGRGKTLRLRPLVLVLRLRLKLFNNLCSVAVDLLLTPITVAAA